MSRFLRPRRPARRFLAWALVLTVAFCWIWRGRDPKAIAEPHDWIPTSGVYEVVAVDRSGKIWIRLPTKDRPEQSDSRETAIQAETATRRAAADRPSPDTVRQAQVAGLLLMGIRIDQPDFASKYLRKRIVGSQVHVLFDRRRLASTGELLAYLFLDEEQNLLLNQLLIRIGMASIDPHHADNRSIARRLRSAADENLNAGY